MTTLSKTEKIISNLTILFFFLSLAGYLGFHLFGSSLIERIYEGRSLSCLNQLIQYQHKYDLAHYQQAGTVVFHRLLIVFWGSYLVLTGFVVIVHRLFLSTKSLAIGWVILWAISTQGLVHILNPFWHIYANHGLFRAGIIYQIMNGYIPPRDPLFAGEVIRAPWGDLWLVAQFSMLFNRSPFLIFSIMNLCCLAMVLYLVYLISRLIIDNKKANILSALTAVFSLSPIGRWFLEHARIWFGGWSPEIRSVPAFNKFPDVCGDPIGLVFFCLFIYSVQICYCKRPTLQACAGMVISIPCVLFFYPPFAPAVAIICAGLVTSHFLLSRRMGLKNSGKSSLLLLGALLAGGICCWPYWKMVSSGVGTKMELFSGPFILMNALNVLLFMGFTGLLIGLQWQRIRNHVWNQPFLLLFGMCSVLLLGYLSIHIPGEIEYKLLLLAGLCFGILGGIAFYMLGSQKRWIAAGLFILFTCPSLGHVYRYGFQYGTNPFTYGLYGVSVYEKGCDVYVSKPEEQQMYDWIKTNTARDAFFLDTTLHVPVFAKRWLYIGLDRLDGQGEPGYLFSLKKLQIRNGYSPETYEFRTAVARNFYGYEDTMSRQEVLECLKKNDIFIIIRDYNDSMKMQTQDLVEVFCSSAGAYRIYRVQ